MMPGWPSTMQRVLPSLRRRSWSISIPSSARLPPIPGCLFSRHPKQLPPLIPLRRGDDRRARREPAQTQGVTQAVNEYPPDQGGSVGASLQRWDTGEVSHGAGGGDQEDERATPGHDLWLGALVPRV